MSDIVWHGHHSNKFPLERLDGTLAERQEDIRRNKPIHEQATRLRLLRPASEEAQRLFCAYEEVCNQAWRDRNEVCNQAWRVYEEARDQAWRVYEEARDQGWHIYEEARDQGWRDRDEVCNQAWRVYEDTRDQARQDILALHATECFPDCEWNGKEIVFTQ